MREIIDGDGLVEERTDSGEKVPSLMDGLGENLDNKVLHKRRTSLLDMKGNRN